MNARIRKELGSSGASETKTYRYWLDERIEALEDKDLCRHVVYIMRKRRDWGAANEICGVWSEQTLNIKEV